MLFGMNKNQNRIVSLKTICHRKKSYFQHFWPRISVLRINWPPTTNGNSSFLVLKRKMMWMLTMTKTNPTGFLTILGQLSKGEPSFNRFFTENNTSKWENWVKCNGLLYCPEVVEFELFFKSLNSEQGKGQMLHKFQLGFDKYKNSFDLLNRWKAIGIVSIKRCHRYFTIFDLNLESVPISQS